MKGDLSERAKAMLSDYLYELETGDRKGHRSYGQARSTPTPRPQASVDISSFSRATDYQAGMWEKEQLKIWRANGRIDDAGRLRVSQQPTRPYTLEDVIQIMPHLSKFDRLAVLIDLDGVVKEGYMSNKEHENIRAVVENIADERLTRRLQSEETSLILSDIVRREVSAIFGELLTRAKQPATALSPTGRKLKCSKCRVPGHRATTCQASAEQISAAKAEQETGKSANA